MGASIVLIDDFLDDYPAFEEHCRGLSYAGAENPADGVVYPDISTEIPVSIKNEVLEKLSIVAGAEIENEIMFLRLSVDGVKAPHQAHTDRVMGDYAMMLYLGDTGGTAFVRHVETGMSRTPANRDELKTLEDDTNKYEAWEQTSFAEMAPNRAVIFDSNLMHRAEPVNGYGTDAKDGRLVMVCFFGVAA